MAGAYALTIFSKVPIRHSIRNFYVTFSPLSRNFNFSTKICKGMSCCAYEYITFATTIDGDCIMFYVYYVLPCTLLLLSFFLSSRMLYMHDAMMAAAITCLTVIRYRALGCAQALEDWRVPYRIGDIWLKWKSINEMTCQNRSPARYLAIVKHSMAINVDINIFSCSIRFRHALDEMVHVRLPVILLYLYLVWVNICGSGKIIMYLFLYLFIGIVQWLLLLTVCVCVGTLLIKPFRFSLHLKQMNGFAWYKR